MLLFEHQYLDCLRPTAHYSIHTFLWRGKLASLQPFVQHPGNKDLAQGGPDQLFKSLNNTENKTALLQALLMCNFVQTSHEIM